MLQTRIESLKEACHNTWIGYILSLLTQEFIITPVFHLHTNPVQNLGIVSIFTVVSVGRNYTVRRYNVWKTEYKGTLYAFSRDTFCRLFKTLHDDDRRS